MKVKTVHESAFGLRSGEVYEAYPVKDKIGNTEVLGVVNQFGEEYAFPKSWFTVLNDCTNA